MTAILALLRPYWLPLAVAAVLLGWVGALKVELWHAESQTEQAQAATVLAQQDKQRILATYAAAAASAASAALAETSRRITDQAEAANEAQRQSNRARADAAGAATAAVGLRNAARTVAASCSGGASNPAAIASSPPASAPGLVLADVLGRADAVAGELAIALDASRIAGSACERSYDALTP